MAKKYIPQIRFKGFEGEWEEKKIEDVYKRSIEKNDLTYREKDIISVANLYYKPEVKVSSKEYLLSYNVFKLGDIAFEGNKSTDFSHGRFVENTIGDGIVSHVFDVYRPIIPYDIQYWKYAINNENVMRSLLIRCTKSATMMSALVASDFLKQKINVPNLSEQSQIGTLFCSLDKQISCSEEKLDKLRVIKKTLLKKMFASQGEKTPQIRFKGFEGEWEENALNNWIEPSKEKNIENKYSKNDVLSVSGDYGVVNQIEFQGRSFAGVSVSNYGVLHTNDIVYTKSPLKANPYGIIKTNIGQTGIVSTLYAIYKSKENVEPIFVQKYFEFDNRLNLYLRPLVRKGAKNDMKVSSEDAIKGNVIFPKKEEQSKISKFFQILDKQISCQERKTENLKAIKKTLLKKMFV